MILCSGVLKYPQTYGTKGSTKMHCLNCASIASINNTRKLLISGSCNPIKIAGIRPKQVLSRTFIALHRLKIFIQNKTLLPFIAFLISVVFTPDILLKLFFTTFLPTSTRLHMISRMFHSLHYVRKLETV